MSCSISIVIKSNEPIFLVGVFSCIFSSFFSYSHKVYKYSLSGKVMFNRRGVVGPILTIFFIAFIVLVVLITAVGPSDPAIQALPDTIEKTYGVFSRILTPIFEGLYKLVAPADPDENVRM